MLFSEFLCANHLYFPSDLIFFMEVGKGTISTVSQSVETSEVGWKPVKISAPSTFQDIA